MTTNQSTNTNRTNAIRRLMAGVILSAAPLLMVIGTATAHAQATTTNSPDPSFTAPAQHPAFPEQTNQPMPGTPAHHHHQHNHGG